MREETSGLILAVAVVHYGLIEIDSLSSNLVLGIVSEIAGTWVTFAQ